MNREFYANAIEEKLELDSRASLIDIDGGLVRGNLIDNVLNSMSELGMLDDDAQERLDDILDGYEDIRDREHDELDKETLAALSRLFLSLNVPESDIHAVIDHMFETGRLGDFSYSKAGELSYKDAFKTIVVADAPDTLVETFCKYCSFELGLGNVCAYSDEGMADPESYELAPDDFVLRIAKIIKERIGEGGILVFFGRKNVTEELVDTVSVAYVFEPDGETYQKFKSREKVYVILPIRGDKSLVLNAEARENANDY